jgi:hypothetical protein
MDRVAAGAVRVVGARLPRPERYGHDRADALAAGVRRARQQSR